MAEIFSKAKERALMVLLEEEETSAYEDIMSLFPEGGGEISVDQKKEVVDKVFTKIKEELEPIIEEFRANGWEVEFDFNEQDSVLTAIFSDTDDEVFYINYYVGPHDINKKDGIVVEGLSFAAGEMKFSVSIDHEEGDAAKGIGSYRGVVEVTKKIAENYLEKYFIKTLTPSLLGAE